jgi:hypothetical protein
MLESPEGKSGEEDQFNDGKNWFISSHFQARVCSVTVFAALSVIGEARRSEQGACKLNGDFE